MFEVRITGWQSGFNKVAFNRLLRDKTGCSLREAKHAVDRLLNGEQISFHVRDGIEFREGAESLGATCSLADRQ